jgi:hypothetical protein
VVLNLKELLVLTGTFFPGWIWYFCINPGQKSLEKRNLQKCPGKFQNRSRKKTSGTSAPHPLFIILVMFFSWGIFTDLKYFIQHCFICHPSGSIVHES